MGINFEYIFEKSMLIELASNGCKKYVINRLDREWKKKYSKDEDKRGDENYIGNKLATIPVPDKPPLADIKRQGEDAELLKVSELALQNRIVSENGSDKEYKEFINEENLVIFCPQNKAQLDEIINDNQKISGDDFRVELILDEEKLVEKFKKIFNPSKYDYVYQPQFQVEDDFFYPLIKDTNRIKQLLGNNLLSFKSLRPDLIKIVGSHIQCRVLDENFNIINSSPCKIKLQVGDIKMSEFTNKYFAEIGLYMMALNSFIYNHGLQEYYEVMAVGIILPENLNITLTERLERISQINTEIWSCDFATVKSKLANVFENEVPEVIQIIEEEKVDQYNLVHVNSKCQTCDYYGGQFSDSLKKDLKKVLKINTIPTKDQILKYLQDPKNNYCRYCQKSINSINILPELKAGEKKLLLNNKIRNNSQLANEIEIKTSKIFEENKTLRADRKNLQKALDIRKDNKDYMFKQNNTQKIPKYSNLTIYLDERHDTQGRNLTFAFSYLFNGVDPNGNKVNENNFKDIYISVVEDNEPILEKRKFIDFLIKINEVLDKYEMYQDNYGRNATFSIIYWSAESMEHLKDKFLSIAKYFLNLGKGIEEVYYDLPKSMLDEKRREIKKLVARFNLFFTSDDELQDYRIVENNPMFVMKDGVEDLFILNVDYSNTLLRTYNILCDENKVEIFCKPDSDQFNGGIFTRVWSAWKDSTEKDSFIRNDLVRVIKDRLFALQSIHFFIAKEYRNYIKGTAPEIPLPSNLNLFSRLKYGLDLVMFQRLNTVINKIEKQSIHNEDSYIKTVLGNSVLLEYELADEVKNKILKDLNLVNVTGREYRAYKMSKDSKDAKIDNNTFFITMYPEDKGEFIFKKFSEDPAYERYSIIYDKNNGELDGVNFNKGKGRGIKSYLEAFGIKIIYFNRFDQLIVIELPTDTLKILQHMEGKYGFDYSKNIIIEEIHVDLWEKKLKQALERLEKNSIAKELVENFVHKQINSVDVSDIEATLGDYYLSKQGKKNVPLDLSQKEAIKKMLNNLLTILWGPPGTGKSHTLQHFLLNLYLADPGMQKRILILGNYDATDNIMKEAIKLLDENDVAFIRVKSASKPTAHFDKGAKNLYREFNAGDSAESIMKLNERFQVFSSTPHQIEKVFSNKWSRKFAFDYVIVDEASQMEVGQFLPGLIKINENTQFIIAGDHLQLEPVLKVRVNAQDINIFGSIYDFYNKEYGTLYPQIRAELKSNRRSNRSIVEFSKIAFDYPEDYEADVSNANEVIKFNRQLDQENLYDMMLEPNEPIVLLSYTNGFSQQSNEFEAEQVVECIKNIWNKELNIPGSKQVYNIIELFNKGLGVVVPHRAQRTLIQEKLLQYFLKEVNLELNQEEKKELEKKIISSVDTVERYQGQQRDIMIASYVLEDMDLIAQEEEFIYNPNRLNVVISRARFKVIVFASDSLINYTSDKLDVIKKQESFHKLIEYCSEEKTVLDERWKQVNGRIRIKSIV